MGIYIKGMEMPKSCSDCPLCYGMMECSVSNISFFKVKEQVFDFRASCTERHPNCPLVPVQPHGRLGDLDELHKEAVRRSEKAGTHDIWYNCADHVICALDIKNAPTIIPAEPEEEEIK